MTKATACLKWSSWIRRPAIRCVLVLGFALAQMVVASGKANAQEPMTFTTLYAFKGSTSGDGAFPLAGLIRDGAGNFYGTTGGGGTGHGTVFKLDTAGVETVLYRFKGYPDGIAPDGPLALDGAGNLYGATLNGGGPCSGQGCGTVFKVDTMGRETVVHRFGGGPDGQLPFGGVVRDGSGNLYGTAALGGAGLGNCGTVFKVDATGTAALYSFLGGTDGCVPESDLVRDAEGNFYGTTTGSGTPGTVFKVDPTGMETVLYRFLGGTDGAAPFAGLVRDAAGNLYGTTMSGSGSAAYGTVFKVDTTGKETVLHAFAGPPDGAYPMAELVLDAAGNLYGTTTQGGSGVSEYGIVFKIDPAGTETVLHRFSGMDGATPKAGLLLDAVGSLYGTTQGGGAFGFGTVFKISHRSW
jgi:uncharacterized repeat protein (TIGR03803 family)